VSKYVVLCDSHVLAFLVTVWILRNTSNFWCLNFV